MYLKLALRNIRRSVRDYAVYFITLLFGVAVFYAFNSIGSQQILFDMETSASRSVFDSTTYIPVSYTHLDVYKRQAESFLVRAELFSRPFFQATPHKPPNSDGLAKAATFSRPYYPTFRLRDETLGILKEEKCA